MALFSEDAGILTVGFLTSWPLRMRVNMSAMGSLILILLYLAKGTRCEVELPARLDQARNIAPHRGFAQLVAAQSEFPVVAMWPACQLAPVALAARTSVSRH